MPLSLEKVNKLCIVSINREKVEDGSELMFDHGAQYFTVKTAEVQQLVDKWQASGIVADWEGRFGTLNVATGEFVEDTVRALGFKNLELKCSMFLVCLQHHMFNLGHIFVCSTGCKEEVCRCSGNECYMQGPYDLTRYHFGYPLCTRI